MEALFAWIAYFLGVACNLIAVKANHGLMPVRNWTKLFDDRHVRMGRHTRFKLLCDIIPVWLGRKRYIASIGDVLLVTSTAVNWVLMFHKFFNDLSS